MGVQVDRLVEPAAQRSDELVSCARPQQTGHVLDTQQVHAGIDEMLGDAQVVVERVEVLGRIGEVARVAHGPLDQGVGLERRLDGRPHLLDVVERIEDSEQIDAGACRLGDESASDRVGIRAVADRVPAP